MSSINLPAGRDLPSEYSKTLSAQISMLPNLLAAQAQYQPVQSANQLSNLNSLLLGTPDQEYTSQIYTPSVRERGGVFSYGSIPKGTSGYIAYPNLPNNIPQTGKTGGSGGGIGGVGLPGTGGGGLPGISGTTTGTSGGGFNWDGMVPSLPGGGGGGLPGMPGGGGGGISSIMDPFGLFGGGDGPPTNTVSPAGYRTVTHTLPAQRGLLGLQSIARGSDIADVANLGPGAMQAFMMSDPRTSGLLEQMTTQTGTELGMGANLDPSLMRLAQQTVRGRQTGMLGGTGSAGDLGEALGVSAFGQNLRQQRLANASSVSTLRNQIYGDPFQRVLGRNSTASSAAMGLSGQGATNRLNPESSYAEDLYNTNYNSLVNKAIADANNQNALIGAGISAVGSLGGAAMGMI